MQMKRDHLSRFEQVLTKLEEGFKDLPDLPPETDSDKIISILMDVAARMQDNYPYHHPLI